MIELKPDRIIEIIKNKKTGAQYMSDDEWRSKGIPESDIQKDVTVVMPSLDLLGKTK